jgi:predicted nucleotidyltransferase
MKPSKEEILQVLTSLKSQLKEEGIEAIALFGSFARNETNLYSDIDIALKKESGFIEKYGPYGYFELTREIKAKLSQRFGRKIDIFDLDAPSPLKPHIQKELIYV